MLFTSDAVGSDDLDAVLEMTRETNGASARQPEKDSTNEQTEPSYAAKSRIQGRLSELHKEIRSIDDQLSDLQRLRSQLTAEVSDATRQLNALSGQSAARTAAPIQASKNSARASGSRQNAVDYTQEFEWSAPMKARMKQIFSIPSFRLCQEGVCNASMDGRDIVCVMPTGGGKSLTYQLPAILSPGCTLVISPLISLITDQILHLREAGVEAVMLTGATSKEESKNISARLNASARQATGSSSEREIKLVYVTPEKIAKSKMFMNLLEKLASAGKLARIVIDEAHCVSQLGHDFRPDYKKLSVLKQFFPYVPILALSATCPPKVLADLLKVLRLKPVVDGNAANTDGTVYFSAPLYRKNLHYSIVPKPASGPAVIKAMTDYILEHHPKDSGIVYCLSKKDTETVAQGLIDTSEGKIRAGVYHADVNDAQKERLHVKWRTGEIQVVCATIAFGLGIDKSNVRFVLHHSMSKSLDGFYQESGRAGRDGNDADCVLYYRGQDASRLSALICGEIEGQDKLHAMLGFAQDLSECRKILFAQYFSTSSSLSLSAWSEADGNSLTRCGHCDNCIRLAESVTQRDATLESWQILRVLEHVAGDGGRVTIGMLSDLVRGAGGGAFSGNAEGGGGRKGKGKSKEKVALDLDEVAGGKITMNKNDVEALIIHLILTKYLKEDFHATAYSVNVYVVPGPQAIRLTRHSRIKIEAGEGSRISYTFPASGSGKGRRKSQSGSTSVPAKRKASASAAGSGARKKKARPSATANDESDEMIEGLDDIPDEEDSDDASPITPRPSSKLPKRKPRLSVDEQAAALLESSDDDEFGEDVGLDIRRSLSTIKGKKRTNDISGQGKKKANSSKATQIPRARTSTVDSGKGKGKAAARDEDEDVYRADSDDSDWIVHDSEGIDPDENEGDTPGPPNGRNDFTPRTQSTTSGSARRPLVHVRASDDEDDASLGDEDEDDLYARGGQWSFSLGGAGKDSSRRGSLATNGGSSRNPSLSTSKKPLALSTDVLEISSD